MRDTAVILFSGGLDSTVALARALDDGFDVVAFSVDYGQKNRSELAAAKAVCRHYGVEQVRVKVIWPGGIAGSSLTSNKVALPVKRSKEERAAGGNMYVPARNTFLLGLAASYAEGRGASHIYVGFTASELPGVKKPISPDASKSYVSAYNTLLAVGMKKPVTIEAPFLMHGKSTVVVEALRLHVPLELTWSCYNSGKKPCEQCDACLDRGEAVAFVLRDLGVSP